MKSLFTGIEHIAIAAANTESLSGWYCTHLGFEMRSAVDNGPAKQKTYFIRLGWMFLEVMPALNEMPRRDNLDRGLSHVAILVSDFDTAVSQLNAVEAKKEGSERAGPWNSRIQFYRDPEGNLFHLLWRPAAL